MNDNFSYYLLPRALNSKLDQLGKECPTNPQQDTTLWKKWKYDVWAFLYEHWVVKRVKKSDNGSADTLCDAINQFITHIKPFDPTKGTLSKYARTSIMRNCLQREGVAQEKLDNIIIVSLEVENGGEGETCTREIPVNEDTEGDLISQEQAQKLQMKIAMYIVLLRQKRKNSTQPILFPLWYTEKATLFAQKNAISFQDEKYLFQAMNLNYLDFFLADTCRSWDALKCSNLKKYKDIDPNLQHNKELTWKTKTYWLPVIVPKKYSELYFTSALNYSNISRSREAFRKEIGQLLGIDITQYGRQNR